MSRSLRSTIRTGNSSQAPPRGWRPERGSNSLQPSVTVLLPTAPGVLFANLQYVHNLGRTQKIQDRQGGPATPVKLQPGESPSLTFGIGFALNDRAALTLSYQQTHVFAGLRQWQRNPGIGLLLRHLQFRPGLPDLTGAEAECQRRGRRRPEHAGGKGAFRAAVQVFPLTRRLPMLHGRAPICPSRRSSPSRCLTASSAARS